MFCTVVRVFCLILNHFFFTWPLYGLVFLALALVVLLLSLEMAAVSKPHKSSLQNNNNTMQLDLVFFFGICLGDKIFAYITLYGRSCKYYTRLMRSPPCVHSHGKMKTMVTSITFLLLFEVLKIVRVCYVTATACVICWHKIVFVYARTHATLNAIMLALHSGWCGSLTQHLHAKFKSNEQDKNSSRT